MKTYYRPDDALTRFSRAFGLVVMGFVLGHILGYGRGRDYEPPDEGMCVEVGE